MTANNSTPVSPADDRLPHFTASEQPVTRAYRIAWNFWVLAVLLTIVVALIFYLIDKLLI